MELRRVLYQSTERISSRQGSARQGKRSIRKEGGGKNYCRAGRDRDSRRAHRRSPRGPQSPGGASRGCERRKRRKGKRPLCFLYPSKPPSGSTRASRGGKRARDRAKAFGGRGNYRSS